MNELEDAVAAWIGSTVVMMKMFVKFQRLILIGLTPTVEEVAAEDAVHRRRSLRRRSVLTTRSCCIGHTLVF